MRTKLVTAAVLGLCTAPAVAQQAGTIELGGFIRYNRYDESFNTSGENANKWGGGGRLGYFFSRRWALELDASGNATDVANYFVGFQSTALTYYPIHLRIMFNHRFGENHPLFWFAGAGPVYNRYGKDVPGEPGFKGSDFGGGVITGFRAMLTSYLAFRVDGTFDYVPSPNNGKDEIVSQANGITLAEPPNKNTTLGLQAGLSVLLGMCNRSGDGTTISPTSANVAPGGTVTFIGNATNCGHPDRVVYSVSGPGAVSPAGVYTASQAGSAVVTACGQRNRLCSTARVTVAAPAPPPPPPPPPRTLVRCEATPSNAQPRIDQPVTITVTCYYSDGTTETTQVTGLVSPGGDVAGSAISFGTPGTKVVTVTIPGGRTLTTNIDVQQINITVSDSAFFQFDKSQIYRPQDQQSLNEVAEVLKAHPEVKLSIDGHADADGTVAYNERLGMRRATAVRNYFASRGVAVDRMTIVLRSFGECVPVAPNATAQGRAMNRRAEIKEFGNTPPGEADAKCAEQGRSRKP